MAIAAAGLALAIIDAENRVNAREPPIRIAKIRRGVEAAFYRTAQNVNNGLMQPANFDGQQAIGAAQRTQSSLPHCLARIDIAEAGDFLLVHQDYFQRAAAGAQDRGQAIRSERGQERIDAEGFDARNLLQGCEPADAAEMAAVDKAKGAALKSKDNVHVTGHSRGIEPEDFAAEPKVQGQPTMVETEQEVFAPAFDGIDTRASHSFFEGASGSIRAVARAGAHGDGVDDPAIANSAANDERPQRSREGLDFRKFRHGEFVAQPRAERSGSGMLPDGRALRRRSCAWSCHWSAQE